MRTCNECLGRSCGPNGIAHCNEQMAEDERHQEEEREAAKQETQQCESCEDADAKFCLKVIEVLSDGVSSTTGKALDVVYVCADCARDEDWHVNKDGKIEC